jgi:PAS domain S-box-containing protein
MDSTNLDGIYEVLFETIAEGLLIVNSQGEVELANQRACEMFLYDSKEIIGKKIEAFIPKSYRKNHVKLREDYQTKPHSRRMGQNMNLKGCRKDGSSFDIEISLNHFISNEEKYITALLTDITDRVVQEKKIRELNVSLEHKVEERTIEVFESQKLYSAIAQNFPNGTINVFDRALKYLFVEGLELRELGIAKGKLIGTSYLDRISQEIRPKIEQELNEVFLGITKTFELDHNGQTYRINSVPLSSEEDKIDKILVVEENITQQKITENQLEEALRKEKQLNELKSRFVSMASHEFRTPLSTVLSSVSLIEKYIEKKQYENTDKHIKRVKSAVAGLTEILNDFLSVDKLESRQNVADKVTIDYIEYVTEIIEELRTILKNGQKINIEIVPELEQIQSDPKILKNILYNLISNAIKYSDENKTITFSSTIHEGELQISIIDEGIGIPSEDQKELFGRFFRAKNATNIKGTGLGLNIVKKYVQMLKGSINFKSELNKGSTFTVQLPLK